MAEMATILSGLATSNEGDAYGLLFTGSLLGPNSKQIYNIWYIRRESWRDENLLLQ